MYGFTHGISIPDQRRGPEYFFFVNLLEIFIRFDIPY